jgi:hypothetical protein
MESCCGGRLAQSVAWAGRAAQLDGHHSLSLVLTLMEVSSTPVSASDMQVQHAASAIPRPQERSASMKTGGWHGGCGGRYIASQTAQQTCRSHFASWGPLKLAKTFSE